MEIKMKTIRFKSIPEYWIKEFNGLKPNTVRVFDDADSRQDVIISWLFQPFKLEVEIENTASGDVFTRTVKDITQFNDVYIISW